MRYRFRNQYDPLPMDSITFTQESNKSILLEVYDKQQQQDITLKQTIQQRTTQYQSINVIQPQFQKRINSYRHSLFELLDQSRDYKQKQMKRIINIANQSRSNIVSSRGKGTYSTIEKSFQNSRLVESRPKSQLEKHIYQSKLSRASINNRKVYSSQQKLYKPKKRQQKHRKSNLGKYKQNNLSRVPSRKSSLFQSLTPNQFNQTTRLMRRRQELEYQLRKINKTIAKKQKVKRKLN